MRSPYTLSACLVAIRVELGDILYQNSRFGCTNEEQAKLTQAIGYIKKAEECCKNFRFIKKIEDLPESVEKPPSGGSRAPKNGAV